MSAPYRRYAVIEKLDGPIDPPERFHYRGCPAAEDVLDDCSCFEDDMDDIKAELRADARKYGDDA